MKKAVIFIAVIATTGLALSEPAQAGSSTDAALGLGAFAVLNQFLLGQTVFQQGLRPQYVAPQPVVVQQPPTVIYAPPPPPVVYYAPPPVVYAPAPVIYPNGYGYAVPHSYGNNHYRRHRHNDDDDD
jgi:hypothetical protein